VVGRHPNAGRILGRAAFLWLLMDAADGLASALGPSVPVWSCRLDLLHHIADRETRRLRTWREILEAFNVPRDDSLSRHKQENPMRLPAAVEYAVGFTLAYSKCLDADCAVVFVE
jgi:hypothetical protein